MKFIKGIVIGSVVSAGIVMMYNENMGMSKKKLMKKGRQVAKKMGII